MLELNRTDKKMNNKMYGTMNKNFLPAEKLKPAVERRRGNEPRRNRNAPVSLDRKHRL